MSTATPSASPSAPGSPPSGPDCGDDERPGRRTGFLGAHRETIALWLLAVLFAVACVGLGRWQLHRYQDKHARAQLVERNYGAAPVPLTQLQPSADAPFDPRQQWRQVVVTGRYDAAKTVLVRNRPHRAGANDPTYGYEVLVPLRLADGTALLVDRGWLPSGSRGTNPAQAPDVVPAPPEGDVRVVARLRASEQVRDRRLPPGQVSSIAVRRVADMTGLPLRPAYGALVSETPAPASAPAPLDPPELEGNEGINASYAVQWALFALLGLGFPVWVRRRQRQAAAEQAREAGEDVREKPGGGLDAASITPRPRRRRIWDADDEDDDAVPD
ncbi:MAG TPA: SURF1 family protein [Actinomycetales bacterium]|nr:SURF1 family protein [Actinomycetales bacterium]